MGLLVGLFLTFGYACMFIGCIYPWIVVWDGLEWFPKFLLVSWHVVFIWCLRWLSIAVSQHPGNGCSSKDPSLQPEALKTIKEHCRAVHPKVPIRLPGVPRFCVPCSSWQKPRAQHCLLCRTCVARHQWHSRLLNSCVGQNNWRSYFVTMLLASICTCSASLWSLLRLFELGFFLHNGPSDPASDASFLVVGAVVVSLVFSCLVAPLSLMPTLSMVQSALRNITPSEKPEWETATLQFSVPWPYPTLPATKAMESFLGCDVLTCAI